MQSPLHDQFIHMMSTLVLFVIVMIVLAFLYKQFGRKLSGATDNLFLVATLSLGTREKLLVVQVGEQQILLGATHQHINKLHELKEPLSVAEKKVPTGKQFKKILDGLKK